MKYSSIVSTAFKKLKQLAVPEWVIIPGILLLGYLDFGLLLPHLGFYLDDWYTLWFAKTVGVSSYPQIYAEDRPFLGYFYVAAVTLLGQTPIVWQIFAFFCRCLAAFAAWWALKQVWPRASRAVAMVALIFLVYPGFKQQWISVCYSPWFLFLAFYLFSIGGMIVSLRSRRWHIPLTALCLVVSVYTMLTTEYYFGLELLRPIFIWICLSPLIVSKKKRIKKTLFYWLPYLAGFLGYWIWRTFFFVSTHYKMQATSDFSAHPLSTLISLVVALAQDAYNATLVAWGQAFLAAQPLSPLRNFVISWGLVILAGLIAFVLLAGMAFGFKKRGALEGTRREAWQFVFVGGVALLLGGIPFWAAGLQVTPNYPWDRFTLAMILGASLLVVGLVEVIFKSIYPKMIIIAVLIAMAAGASFQLARDYRTQWSSIQDYFWELSWRAPGIKPGTILVEQNTGLPYFSANSLTAAINWVYAPGIKTKTFDYYVFLSDSIDGKELLALSPGTTVTEELRTFTFTGSSSQVLGIYYAVGDCVHVLDLSGETLPLIPDDLLPALKLSNTDLIETAPSSTPNLPEGIFGAEPAHDWCFYYEKAELARQEGDWQEVVALGQQVLAKNLEPKWRSEWLPFIEGYAHMGDYTEASSLTLNSYQVFPLMQSGVCETWKRIKTTTNPSEDQQNIIQQILKTANCL